MTEKTVLFVDDDEYLLRMVGYLFLSKGVVLKQAQSGREGLEILKKEKIDAIISDISMPEMNGIEFCGEVRKNAATCRIPIIVLSATPMSDYSDEMKALGVNDFVEKPFSPKDLVELTFTRMNAEK